MRILRLIQETSNIFFGVKHPSSLGTLFLDATCDLHFWMSHLDVTFGRQLWTAFMLKLPETLLPGKQDGTDDRQHTDISTDRVNPSRGRKFAQKLNKFCLNFTFNFLCSVTDKYDLLQDVCTPSFLNIVVCLILKW